MRSKSAQILNFTASVEMCLAAAKIVSLFINEIMVMETYNNTVAALLAPEKHLI